MEHELTLGTVERGGLKLKVVTCSCGEFTSDETVRPSQATWQGLAHVREKESQLTLVTT